MGMSDRLSRAFKKRAASLKKGATSLKKDAIKGYRKARARYTKKNLWKMAKRSGRNSGRSLTRNLFNKSTLKRGVGQFARMGAQQGIGALTSAIGMGGTNFYPFSQYPILGYKFDITFIIDGQPYTSAWQSVSGLSKTTKATKLAEGGNYGVEYNLPGEFNYGEVTFTRGVLRNYGVNYLKTLQTWFESLGWSTQTDEEADFEKSLMPSSGRGFGNFSRAGATQNLFNDSSLSAPKIKTAIVQIDVKDFNVLKQKVTVETITLSDAYPVSVSLGKLDSQKAEVFFEDIKLCYSSYSRRRDWPEIPESIGSIPGVGDFTQNPNTYIKS
tara:strand:- start:275 stop:1255 length:981 start_codon:yes stop_codon:yes gene_type:complete